MKAKPGFLLFELIIAIAIVAVLAAIAIPSLNFLNKQLLATEAEKLHLSFMHMQRMAMLENKRTEISFTENSYQLENQEHKLPQGVKFGFLPNVKGPPSHPTRTVTSAITFPTKKALFQPTGKIGPGTVYLVDEKEKFMYAVTVPVSEISYIRKYRLNDGSWNLVT